MASNYFNQEFLNLNESRAYPLFEEATRLDTTGIFRLPDDFLVGLSFPVDGSLAVDVGQVFLRQVTVYPTGYVIGLGYNDGSGSPPVIATAVIDRATHSEYNHYSLQGRGDFEDSVGTVVIGRIVSIDQQPAGKFLFDYAGGMLDPDCVRAYRQGVSSFSIVTNTGTTKRIQGAIQLVAGTNMQFSVTDAGAYYQVRIDAVDGAGLNETCSCDGDAASAKPILTISGVGPAEDGSFELRGDSCMAITSSGNGLVFEDKCSKPCCGCTELTALQGQMQYMRDQILTLETFSAGINERVMQFNQAVIASKLNDSGCVACS